MGLFEISLIITVIAPTIFFLIALIYGDKASWSITILFAALFGGSYLFVSLGAHDYFVAAYAIAIIAGFFWITSKNSEYLEKPPEGGEKRIGILVALAAVAMIGIYHLFRFGVAVLFLGMPILIALMAFGYIP